MRGVSFFSTEDVCSMGSGFYLDPEAVAQARATDAKESAADKAVRALMHNHSWILSAIHDIRWCRLAQGQHIQRRLFGKRFIPNPREAEISATHKLHELLEYRQCLWADLYRKEQQDANT